MLRWRDISLAAVVHSFEEMVGDWVDFVWRVDVDVRVILQVFAGRVLGDIVLLG
jgi:hypothetical protein